MVAIFGSFFRTIFDEFYCSVIDDPYFSSPLGYVC
jgi:hypothetical protein